MFKPEYQNIFTQVQVHGPADLGVETETGVWERGNIAKQTGGVSRR